MTATTEMSERAFEEGDEVCDPGPQETDFGRLVERAVSRRGFLGGSVGFGAATFVASCGLGFPLSALASSDRFGFETVPANALDTVTVPRGYDWHVVAKWGEPLWSNGVEFDHVTRGTGASQELAFGDNNDGMALYTHEGRSILAVNNEYVNRKIIYGGAGSGSPENADDVRKGKAGHGVSVVEIAKRDGRWSIVKDSPYNRRITADTPMEITGPASGSRTGDTLGRRRTSASTSQGTPRNRTARATWSRSIPGTRTPSRRSAPPSGASSTRTQSWSLPPADRWSSTWATTSGASSSTGS